MEAPGRRPCRGPGRWRRTGRRSRSAGRPAGGAAFRASPIAARGRSSGRYGPRPATRSRRAFAPRGCPDEPSAWRGSFFERLDRPLILRRVTRPGADVREAERLQELADRALVIGDPEALKDDALQVDPAPAHHAVHRPVR